MKCTRAWRVSACVGLLVVAGCSDDRKAADGGVPHSDYRASVRWTGYGIPHIRADDMPSVAYASGYVASRDVVCILADQFVKVRSERARYLGPGDADENLDSDFGMLNIGVHATARSTFTELDAASRELVIAYTAGYNRYVQETSPDDLPSPCRAADWVKAIEPEDLWAYYLWLGYGRSTGQLFNLIPNAAPPSDGSAAMRTRRASASLAALAPRPEVLGSNSWGIGTDRSENGHGMLLANPHYPWQGPRRLYEQHITVPGVSDVYGVGLTGTPLVMIGFNQHVAWTHAVSPSANFTIYRLKLVPGKPTHYMFDGEEREIAAQEYQIDVKQPDGSVTVATRTLYRSHYGPMLEIDLMPWSDSEAYTVRDANQRNTDLLRTYLGMDRATNLADLEAVQDEAHGLPFVNTIAVSSKGQALYFDSSRTAALSADAEAAYDAAIGQDFYTFLLRGNGAVLLDGSSSLFDWQDSDPRVPGIVPYRDSPRLERSDFVANANDSHWLTHPDAPLTGFSKMFGDEETIRSTRTRMNLRMLMETGPESASGEDGKFSLDELAAVPYNNRTLLGELLRDAVVARCKAQPDVVLGKDSIDLRPACAALEAWDLRVDTQSAGAPLWREFLVYFLGGPTIDLRGIFDQPFDDHDPLGTPRDLLTLSLGDDPVPLALATAVARLHEIGSHEFATLGDLQYTRRGDERIPIHGGSNAEGAFNVVAYEPSDGTRLPGLADRMDSDRNPFAASDIRLAETGYPINTGSSFMLAVAYADDGPEARAILSYSQSPDPDSPHYADQTHLFSEKRWRTVLYREQDIAADPQLREETIEGPRPAP